MTDAARTAVAGAASGRVYVVGGAVRDWALGRAEKDLDLAVEGDAATVGQAIADAAGGHFFVMHPASQTARVAFKDGGWLDLVPLPHGLEADLKRRDFTVNAMAVPLAHWLDASASPDLHATRPAFVADPTGGWADLAQGAVRATNIGALTDDPLRVMRTLRLLACLPGAHLEESTRNLLREAIPLLPTISAERRRDEWLQIMDLSDSGASVALAADLGILDQILPEYREMEDVSQNPYHHLDVWGHTLAVLRCFDALSGEPGGMPAELREPMIEYLAEHVTPPHTRRALLRQAILLHDSGKPASRSEDEEGRIRFLGHEHTSEGIARTWAVQYRLSGQERAFIGATVGLHMRPGSLLGPGVSKRAITRFFRDAGPAAPALLLLNVADRLAARGPWTTDEEVETQVSGSFRLLSEWLEMRNTVALPLPVSGKDIMEAFGLGPGPHIGCLIQELRDVHAETPFPHREAALEAARLLIENSEVGIQDSASAVDAKSRIPDPEYLDPTWAATPE